MESCKATKTVTVYNFAVIDPDGNVTASGYITAKNEQSALIALAREHATVASSQILLSAWKSVEVRDPDAIATVRVIGADVTPTAPAKAAK